MPTSARVRTPRAEVREQIIEAAREAFGTSGYAAVSVARVAEQAGFTKGAVYSNFGGKPELFAAAIYANFADLVAVALADTLAAADLDSADAPAQVLAARLATDVVRDSRWPVRMAEFRVLAQADPALRQVYADVRATQRDQLVEVLRGAEGRVAFRPGLDLEVAATLLLTCANGLAVEHAVAPESLPSALVEATLRQVLDGILA